MIFRIDEDEHRHNIRRCAWTCVWSLFVAVCAFTAILCGPVEGVDADIFALFASFAFSIASVLFVFALLIMILSEAVVRSRRSLLRRMEKSDEG